ncbi:MULTISPECIES: glycosyltransferase family 2 protein [Rhodococcus]|uniref:glycosyltransferase n=1 Tax=Rhodococcus TaxID=1827 RepID=UPI0005A70B2D|nr:MULTISPECIES: glycosyltransferase family 2 protein [Rhodococcus]MYV26324.1 glycosyltransferase [Rhodococcus erythropolis]MBW4813116.1 glycosyltransferase family 2 protein [Rhodococcus qingshengii]MCD2130376.1 glycosyltransferase family 2 protein [Rhodococcus qingshengii]MDI9955933.1 glycosyltransferase family 2 protein [Rhodococcus sp. IEGM 1237]MDI9961955.1 glycosyltransferase family 2 protein [Rhodococcus sp. IEGM 1251]
MVTRHGLNSNSGAVSVVMACYSMERLRGIVAAVHSIAAQTLQPAEIIVAVDHNRSLAHTLRREMPGICVISYEDGPRGASGARNAGVAVVSTPYTAFIDDDEIADSSWLSELIKPFADERVVGTGGRYRAVWRSPKPDWFPDEFGWVVGESFHGMPIETSRVRNVWSGSMAVRTAAFRAVGGFRVGFGKSGERSQPEDTDLCIRMAELGNDFHWMYVPTSVIDHDIPLERSTFRFFLARCYSEGKGKIELRDDRNGSEELDDERDYVRSVLTSGLRRYVLGGRVSLSRAGAVVAGIVSAGMGALSAIVCRRRHFVGP